jgi:tetratricopeptide (TPR) repeat protein
MRKLLLSLICFVLLVFFACKEKNKTVLTASVNELNLKTGDVVACGPPDKEFGKVGFAASCPENVKKDFDLAIALLHSFEYDESEKVFAKIIGEAPECAMAYWGVAMSNYHTLWAPPTQAELEKGSKAISIAQSIANKPEREAAYIDAMAVFYKDHDKTDHGTRSKNYEKAMEKLYAQFPQDKEAAIFYALALRSTADPADKTYSQQKRAGEILNQIYPGQRNHPGIVHYIIHCYDYPELAEMALPEARRYASIAPSSAHAQHMPSHIFTRLGLWQECIQSNLEAAASAVCYAQGTGIKGHWDEELHALDYVMYGYLQQGDNDSAKKQLDYLHTITEVSPVNFKVAYAFAAMPSRYVLENRMWKEAATLEAFPANLEWEKYPWQKAIIHFARLMGSVNTGKPDNAKLELKNLNTLRDALLAKKDSYSANQVAIQIKSSEAWIAYKEGKNNEAVQLMTQAADMEDATEKHSVTPGEVLPARELLGDMLMQMNQPAKALAAYEANFKRHVNRFNNVYGAGLAAERSNNMAKAKQYYEQLNSIVKSSKETRPEIKAANAFLESHKAVAATK